MSDFILASGSPRRRELLERLGFVLEVQAADVDESLRDGEPAGAYAERVARDKADTIHRLRPERWVLGADTVVEVSGRALGKAADETEARGMLESLSGREHHVTTAVALLGPQIRVFAVRTAVVFRALSELEIDDYLRSGEWRGKAGAYAIQGMAAAFVPELRGCITNVIGLPLAQTVAALAEVAGLRPRYPAGRAV